MHQPGQSGAVSRLPPIAASSPVLARHITKGACQRASLTDPPFDNILIASYIASNTQITGTDPAVAQWGQRIGELGFYRRGRLYDSTRTIF